MSYHDTIDIALKVSINSD